MISLDKTHKTRDGREAQTWWIGPGTYGPRTVFGAIKCGDGVWTPAVWPENGRVHSGETSTDLIEVKPRHKHKVWMNINLDCGSWLGGGIYLTREDADKCAYSDRIACIERELDFEEGEGL